ncbi:MAG: MFS transporter [Chloroflexota bacterium]
MSAASLLAAQTTRVRHVYRGWWIVLISYYTQLITAGAGGWIFGSLILPMQHDLGWNQKSITVVLLINRIIGGVLAVPLGPIVDRHGSRVLMTVSAVLAGLGLLAVSMAHSRPAVYAAWALYGLATPGIGLLGPRVVIPNWFIRKRATAIAWFSMGSATAGIAAVPAAAWVNEHYGWRMVWFILGIACFSVAPLSWIAVRRRPEDVGLLPDGDEAGAVAAREAARPASQRVREAVWTVRQALRTRAFWLMTAGFLLTSMPSSAIFINISGFVQSFGYTAIDGAWIVSVYGFGVFGGRWVWTWFLGRMGIYRTMIAFAVIYAVSIGVFTMQHSYLGIALTTFWLGVAVSGSQLLNVQAIPDYYGRSIVGSLTGFSTLANTAVGGAAPLLTAAVFDATGGYVPAFLAFGAVCVVAAVSFALSPPPAHPGERARAATA